MRTLVWFRSDLRSRDNSALHHAAQESTRGVVGLFVFCPDQCREHDWAPVKVDFILRTLHCLRAELHKRNIPLLVTSVERFDDVPDLLLDLMLKHQCDALFFNREYESNERKRDEAVHQLLEREGLDIRSFSDQVIVPPGAIRTRKDDFYTVFTPFRKKWIELLEQGGVPQPLGTPKKQTSFATKSGDIPDAVAGFEPSDIDTKLWPAGEREANRRLRSFLQKKVMHYTQERDYPGQAGTSVLSPYLTVGAISLRTCFHSAYEANRCSLSDQRTGAGTWINELIWREFYRHILVGFPRVSMNQPFNLKTRKLKWRNGKKEFSAWCEGRTGVPIVDAGMRQLASIGWIHNRLRMITSMFLTKDLLIDWRWGERWFMQHLIDGDLASNNGGWQWAASTGTDAAPYFRIFNPCTQSRKFDPEGTYIRQYVPELRALNNKDIHEPYSSSSLPQSFKYPKPIVDHNAARARAIEAFQKLS